MSNRITQLLELIQKEPNDSFLNYALALEYAKLNETDKAITIIEEVLKRDENYLGAYYQLGQLFEQMQQINKAKETYGKGIVIARQQKSIKTLGELNTALMLIED